MGLCFSSDPAIEKQEKYVNKRMKDPDIIKLSTMHGSFFHGPHAKKYSKRQVESYLRQEYHGRRKKDSYVLDADLRHAGVSKRAR